MKRKLTLFFSALCVLLLLVGCGSKGEEGKESKGEAAASTEKKDTKENKEKVKLGDYEVSFEGKVTEEDDKFIIEGKSNLLPGARLVGEVLVDEGEEVFSDTTELVEEDGTFYMELAHHQYGDAEIIVRFDFDSVQEDEIKRHYGEKGQKLVGPFIYKHHDLWNLFKKAEIRIPYVANETNELAIKAPNWEELPEDYGDPRVWMDVDEITEDGEFFYLHGKSNLLEGSVIKVEYGHNRDKTAVNPDGTFDFKVDYEYLEDKDFVIEFWPDGLQWNEIEEAYGKKGQKLVGNLAKTNKFNTDVQYVEKVIPWDQKGDSSAKDGEEDHSDEETADDETVKDEGAEDEEK